MPFRNRPPTTRRGRLEGIAKSNERSSSTTKCTGLSSDFAREFRLKSDKHQLERDLDDPSYSSVVSITDTDGTILRFTHDDESDLVLIGECPSCHQETRSRAIESAADLGELLERFEPLSSHDCKKKK